MAYSSIFNSFSSIASKPINIRWIRTSKLPTNNKKNNKIDRSVTKNKMQEIHTGPSANKTGFNLITFYFNNRGKLSIIRCTN